MNTQPLIQSNQLTLDNSALSAWETCPRLFLFKHLLRRERAGTFASRDIGKAWHLAMEAWYRSHDLDKAKEALATGYAGLDLALDETRTLARMLSVLDKYCEHWKDLDSQYEVVAAEQPFRVLLGQVRQEKPDEGNWELVSVYWSGRIDLILRHTQDQSLWIMDHKTMSRWETKTLTEWRNASGPKGYAWVLTELARSGKYGLTQQDQVHGFLLNAIVVREEAKTTRTKLAREEFHREQFYYGPDRLAEWRTNTLAKVQSLVDQSVRDYYPAHEKSCAYQFGRSCSHLEVCESSPETRSLMLSTDLFQDYAWSPLDGQQEVWTL